MEGRATDHRNLDLAKLNTDVVFGRAGGKVIWQPRIDCWWHDREWDGRGFGRYDGGTHEDMYRSLGCSDRLYGRYNPCFRSKEIEGVVQRTERPDDLREVSIKETPVGTISHVRKKTSGSWAMIVEKEWIETPEDMKVMTWLHDHTEWYFDRERFDKANAEVGDLGAPTSYLPRVNVQDLYINTMGVEGAVYALYEWGSVIDDYFKVMHESHIRLIDVINASPVEIVNFGDNLHCQTLSPALFEEYVLPAYLDRCERLHKAGKSVNSHWDGDVKSLLPFAKVCGLDGIEAITPAPQGDVTIEEVKDALGDEIYLMDGIPAIFFDETFSVDVLVECVEKLIKLFAPKLVLGISDEMSSQGDIERIRIVGKIVDDYNASISG